MAACIRPVLVHSALLAAPERLDLPAIVGPEQTWTWRQVHQASIELSQRFRHASAVFILCTSRLNFLVSWLAALRSRVQVVLPPSAGHAALAGILSSTPRPIIVADDPHAIQDGWRSSAECLVCPPVALASKASPADLAWQPDWERMAVQLYTSGSTGAPEPHPKTLLQLVKGAQILQDRLASELAGGVSVVRCLLCSVPPQHMFGVEASVMLSLVYAIAVQEGRPLLPADVQQALAASPASLWIATPMHLRAFVKSGEALASCKLVLTSTMPLTQQLALQTEALAGAPVLEIYGSTETGVLAMRRTAHETAWRPVSGARIERVDDAIRAHGAHFRSPVGLPDEAEIDADGSFRLLGRSADMIKIGGRRASLAGLNLLLEDLPGLEDGVFYLPGTANPTERLCLIYSGPPVDRGEVEKWLRARLDLAFVPRAFIRVDKLPRSDGGKVSRQALDALFATWQLRVGHGGSSGAVSEPSRAFGFEFAVGSEHPALPGHFPGNPIVPGALLLDHVLSGVAAELNRTVSGLKQVKFVAALRPNETAWVVCEADADRLRFSVQARRKGVLVTIANGTLQLAQSQMPLPAGAAPERGGLPS
ncbi:MAG TPA: AMP-binding protein [Burkholderiaceae bacterium]